MESKLIKFQMMIDPKFAEDVDDWGFANRIRTRAEAIRRLVRTGLEHSAPAEKARVVAAE